MQRPEPSGDADTSVRLTNRSKIPTDGGLEVSAVFSYARIPATRRGPLGQAFYRHQCWSPQRTTRDSSDDEDLETTLARETAVEKGKVEDETILHPDKRPRRMIANDNDDNDDSDSARGDR
jgi:hypothetical protein